MAMNAEITNERQKAYDCHQRIQTAAALAQQNIWDMCNALKEMRDGKLYREFGYANFEEYCKEEHGLARKQAYKYCKIAENVQENVYSSTQLGVQKLYLLATLSEPEQTEILNTVDVENTTVKQLEAEIKNHKNSNEQKKSEIQNLNYQLMNTRKSNVEQLRRYEQLNDERRRLESDKTQLEFTNDTLENEIQRLEEQVRELESRPIEVAVAEPPSESDELRRMRETIKTLERNTAEQIHMIQEENLDAERELRQSFAAERKELEAEIQRLRAAEQDGGAADEIEIFNIYKRLAYDAFERMAKFARGAEDRSLCYAHMMDMLAEFGNITKGVIYQ